MSPAALHPPSLHALHHAASPPSSPSLFLLTVARRVRVGVLPVSYSSVRLIDNHRDDAGIACDCVGVRGSCLGACAWSADERARLCSRPAGLPSSLPQPHEHRTGTHTPRLTPLASRTRRHHGHASLRRAEGSRHSAPRAVCERGDATRGLAAGDPRSSCSCSRPGAARTSRARGPAPNHR